MRSVSAVFFLVLALALVGCSDDDGGGGGSPDLPDTGTPDTGPEPEPEPEPDPEFCGSMFPEGLCPTGQLCLDGACVDIGLVCSPSQPEGLCTLGGRCVDGACWGADQVCNSETPIGVCPTGQFCDQGHCTTGNPCGPGEPAGSCEGDAVCFESACRAVTEVCGELNTEGVCPDDRACLGGTCVPETFLCSPDALAGRCISGETCSGGECMAIDAACSFANPGGSCGGGLSCLEGACRNPSDLCSPENPFGFCAMGLSCVDGVCQEQTLTCDYEVFDGLCPEGMDCSAGHCHGPVACDDLFVYGACPMGQTCMCGGGAQAVSQCSGNYAPDSASTDQRKAIERTNELRNSIGLWSIGQNAEINVAAQAHADYIVNEANEAHDQTRTNSPYFTGTRFGDRMRAAGYQGQPFSEVISYIGEPVRSVDELVATVYHREPFFNPFALDMGYGGASGPNGSADVIDFGGAAQACVEDILVVFPPHNAVDVPISWDGRENPLPPPPPTGYPSGPVISVHGSNALDIREHVLQIGDSPIEHTHLTSDNDPNGSVGQGAYFLYAHEPLRPGTTYEVIVSGFHGSEPFYLRWSFTTGR